MDDRQGGPVACQPPVETAEVAARCPAPGGAQTGFYATPPLWAAHEIPDSAVHEFLITRSKTNGGSSAFCCATHSFEIQEACGPSADTGRPSQPPRSGHVGGYHANTGAAFYVASVAPVLGREQALEARVGADVPAFGGAWYVLSPTGKKIDND